MTVRTVITTHEPHTKTVTPITTFLFSRTLGPALLVSLIFRQ